MRLKSNQIKYGLVLAIILSVFIFNAEASRKSDEAVKKNTKFSVEKKRLEVFNNTTHDIMVQVMLQSGSNKGRQCETEKEFAGKKGGKDFVWYSGNTSPLADGDDNKSPWYLKPPAGFVPTGADSQAVLLSRWQAIMDQSPPNCKQMKVGKNSHNQMSWERGNIRHVRYRVMGQDEIKPVKCEGKLRDYFNSGNHASIHIPPASGPTCST